MKRIISTVFVLAFFVAGFVVNAQEKPKITFEKIVHDYGTFNESEGVKDYDFVFTNEGSVPLVINNVRASCGCTTPKWTREPVAPGGKGSVKVSYNPKNRPGSFNKTVTVQSNASNSNVMLRVKGNTKPRQKTVAELYPRKIGKLRVKRNHISFVKMKNTEVKTQEIELVNDTDEPVAISFKSVPKELQASLTMDTIPARKKGMLKVTLDATKIRTFGLVSKRIYLTVDGSKNYKNSVGVSATIVEDFSHLSEEDLANAPVVSFDTKSHNFGQINQGDKVEHTFQIKNAGKNDLIIRRVRSSCGCTAVSPAKKVIPAGETAPIRVVFDSRGKKGNQTKSITVITNDPKNPTSTLRVSSQVKVQS